MFLRVVYIIKFFTVIICTLSTYTFAMNTPQPRQQSTRARQIESGKTCFDWISHYGFRGLRANHKNISLWAASFLYGLCQNKEYTDLDYLYKPFLFCNRHVMKNALYPFMTLRDAEFSCEGWINFYGYDHKVSQSTNVTWAKERDIQMDPYISIWAASYFIYIMRDENKSQTRAAAFCHGIGHEIAVNLPYYYPFMTIDGSKMSCFAPQLLYDSDTLLNYHQLNDNVRREQNSLKKLKFLTLNDTYLSCQDWIHLYGYGNDFAVNRGRVLARNPEFDYILAHWTKRYVSEIRSDSTTRNPSFYCRFIKQGTSLYKYDYFGNLQGQSSQGQSSQGQSSQGQSSQGQG